QASVLKVTANGTTTSPVTRGAWVLDRILGQPAPPPPANVSAIEPDVRGSRSIRDQLATHRTDASCAPYQATIHPPGFPLDRLAPPGLAAQRSDVVGGRRDRCPADLAAAPEDQQAAGPARRATARVGLGPVVDAAGAMPDGASFGDFEEFRSVLAADPDRLVR